MNCGDDEFELKVSREAAVIAFVIAIILLSATVCVVAAILVGVGFDTELAALCGIVYVALLVTIALLFAVRYDVCYIIKRLNDIYAEVYEIRKHIVRLVEKMLRNNE